VQARAGSHRGGLQRITGQVVVMTNGRTRSELSGRGGRRESHGTRSAREDHGRGGISENRGGALTRGSR
jgi:hypothetical protein